MAYDYFSPDGNAGRPLPKVNWYTDGAMVPIYIDGDLLTCVPVCFDWAYVGANHYEIADIRYGSVDGVLLPDIEDIHSSIREKFEGKVTLIFPDEMAHDSKL